MNDILANEPVRNERSLKYNIMTRVRYKMGPWNNVYKLAN